MKRDWEVIRAVLIEVEELAEAERSMEAQLRIDQRMRMRPAMYPPATEAKICVRISQRMVTVPMVAADNPSPEKGDIAPNPNAEPRTTSTMERPSAAKAPANTADQLMAEPSQRSGLAGEGATRGVTDISLLLEDEKQENDDGDRNPEEPK